MLYGKNAECEVRLTDSGPAARVLSPMSQPDTTHVGKMLPPATSETDAKLRHVVALMGKLLIARKDVKAIENDKGWMPDRERAPRGTKAADMPCIPMRMEDFKDHMFGKRCMGTYLLDLDNNVRFFALDIDLKTENAIMFAVPDLSDIETAYRDYRAGQTGEWPSAILDIDTPYVGNLEEALHNPNHVGYRWARLLLDCTIFVLCENVEKVLGLKPLPVITGGGAHVLVPLGSPTPAIEARAMATAVMDSTGYELFKGDCFYRPEGNEQAGVEIEVFPKQDKLTDSGSFGNLIRLPLGWHAKAGMRTYFLNRAIARAGWELPKANAVEVLEQAAASVGIEV